MATKYIQVGYHLPHSNSSLDSITVDENPITEVKCIMSEMNLSDTGEVISILVGDPNFGTNKQTWDQVDDFVGGSGKADEDGVDSDTKRAATGAMAPVVQTDASITAWKWLNAKVEIADSVTNIEQDIKDNYTIDGGGNIQLNVDGITIVDSHITNGTDEDFQVIS